MSVSLYQGQVTRLQGEIARLQQKQSEEHSRAIKAMDEAARAESSITKHTSASSANSKIQQANGKRKKAAEHDKKAGQIGDDISRKLRSLHSAENNLQRALERERKKEEAAEKKRRRDAEKHVKDMQREQRRLEQQAQSSRRAELSHERALTQEVRSRDQLHAATVSQAALRQLPKGVTILFVSAGPRDENRLDIAEEARDVAERIRAAEHRDAVKLEHLPAIRPKDLIPALNRHKPPMLHFAGHGSAGEELVFQDEDGEAKPVSAKAITATVATVADDVQVVVLNACHTSTQAEALTEHVPVAIGMAAAIGDEAARAFSTALYGAIADGFSVQRAFDQALAQLQLDGTDEESTPQLFVADGVDADEIVLVRPPNGPLNGILAA